MTCVAPAFERPPSGKVYTVYDRRDGRVYGLRHERTALVAFRCAQDAFTVSRALERHYTAHGEYPEHNLEDYPRALDALLPAPPSFRRPKFLRMRAWKSADQLMDMCRWNGLTRRRRSAERPRCRCAAPRARLRRCRGSWRNARWRLRGRPESSACRTDATRNTVNYR